MRDDLARVADGRIDPALGDDYGLLALLDKGQPATREWQLLAQLCRTQTARFRAMPEQMRARAADKSARRQMHEEPEPEN